MTHIHEQTGKEYEVGRLIDGEGKTYDINVIMKWDTEHDFDQSPVLIDYYFGDPESDYNNKYIDMFIERRNQLRKVVKHLESQKKINQDFLTDSDETEFDKMLDEMIETVKSLITDLV
jgi:hypothetical protein